MNKDRYTLEYHWRSKDGLRIGKGEVRVNVVGEIETHELWQNAKQLGEYKVRVNGTDDGETYAKGSPEPIGKGNLLAGILLVRGTDPA